MIFLRHLVAWTRFLHVSGKSFSLVKHGTKPHCANRLPQKNAEKMESCLCLQGRKAALLFLLFPASSSLFFNLISLALSTPPPRAVSRLDLSLVTPQLGGTQCSADSILSRPRGPPSGFPPSLLPGPLSLPVLQLGSAPSRRQPMEIGPRPMCRPPRLLGFEGPGSGSEPPTLQRTVVGILRVAGGHGLPGAEGERASRDVGRASGHCEVLGGTGS